MQEVYPGSPPVPGPSPPEPDTPPLGLLADGTPVVVLEATDRFYQKRIWGFDPGLWEHALCFDGQRYLVESTRLGFGDTHVRYLTERSRWLGHVPRSTYCRCAKYPAKKKEAFPR